IQPTFSEYERMCEAHACEINYFTIEPEESICLNEFEEAVKSQEAVFFCNPNNPTGKHVKKAQLEAMAKICFKNDCLFIVDEAFYDFLIDYDESVKLHKQYSNIVFLRSLTKIYSIAGLSLGYLDAISYLSIELDSYLHNYYISE